MKELLTEIVISLIYHGRHFSPKRDDVVIKKTVTYLMEIINKGGQS